MDFSEFMPAIRASVSALTIGMDYGLNPTRDGRCRCIFCNSGRKDAMRLYPGERGFYCFKCHEGGDVIKLVRTITGESFQDAVREINDKYGLGLPLDRPDPERTRRAKEEAERKRQERIEKEKQDRKLTEEYLDAADMTYRAEQVIKNEAPQSMDEEPSDRFVAALMLKEELRDRRDRLFDEVYRKD